MSRLSTMAASMLALGAGMTEAQAEPGRGTPPTSAATERHHPYSGMWVTADGRVRHRLLPGGRYEEARGQRECAYLGRYEITGDHIEYWDDTGFTADGDFIDGVLHHGGMILYRRPEMETAARGC